MSTLFLILLIINLIALIIVFLMEKPLGIPSYTKHILMMLLSMIVSMYGIYYNQELKEEKQQLEQQKAIYQKIIQNNK